MPEMEMGHPPPVTKIPATMARQLTTIAAHTKISALIPTSHLTKMLYNTTYVSWQPTALNNGCQRATPGYTCPPWPPVEAWVTGARVKKQKKKW